MSATGLRIRADLLPRTVNSLPLNVYVGAWITLLLMVFGATVVLYNFQRDRADAYGEAGRVFDAASAHAVSEVRALFGPVASTVELAAKLPELTGASLAVRWSTVPFIVEALRNTPTISAMYAGYEDGEFFLVRALRGDARIHAATGAPDHAAFVVQSIDRIDGALRQTFHYLDDALRVIDRNRRYRNNYDPRQRPWYHAAAVADGIVLSPVYVFTTTRELGATLSRRLPGDSGVIGADMAMTEYAARLDALRIGDRGRIVVFDEQGRVSVTNDVDTVLRAVRLRPDGSSIQPLVTEVDDPVIAGSYAGYVREGTGKTLVHAIGDDVWLSRFIELYLAGNTLTLGILAPGDLFLAESEQTRNSNLLVSLLMFLIALPVAWLIARFIARPVSELTEETERIRRFELEDDVVIRTRVSEVRRLGEAMQATKASLRDFGRFMPKQLVRDLASGRARATLGGERREVSLLFTDIEGFTKLSERLEPQALMEKTSDYFERVGRAIIENGGTIDKYMGDAIMAFWNAPERQEDHAALLCEAALAAAAASRALDQELLARGESAMFTRFGLHLGNAVVGNVGSIDRMDFTVLGAAVNLASRLEGLNKRFHTQLLASGAVRDRVAERYLFRPVDAVIPKGSSRAVPVFELVGSNDPRSPHAVDASRRRAAMAWTTAYALYRNREWDAAIRELQGYIDTWPDDAIAPGLLARCERFRDTPPPGDWDGTDPSQTG